jgi:ABC-type branched-subunit amino acid transport system ATPase component
MLKVEGLSKSFLEVHAVSGLDLQVKQGVITALIGPNGAGKTTTFNMITGFLRPDTGRVLFEGEDITRHKSHSISLQGLARTFQGVEAFSDMSVFDNVMIGASRNYSGRILPGILRLPVYKKAESQSRKRAMESLDIVGLLEEKDKPADSLSFGQLRLMEIARCLATNPKIILLDEPGAGLNSREVEILAEVLKGLNALGTTIFIIDHDMQLVMDISDTVLVMDRGKKIATGTPDAIQSDRDVIAAYLGT